jgi:hypothetical protein
MLKSRVVILAVFGLLSAALIVPGVAIAGEQGETPKNEKQKKAKKKKHKKHKVSVCHREGNGSYHLIRIAKPAVKAHLKHGDAFPGDQVEGGTLSAKCELPAPQPQRFTSPTLDFGPNGWAGWSCPTGMKAVGGGHTLVDVTASGVAQPGATIGGSTYPTFPHYTFAAGETGFVVQNDDDTESGTVFVDCVPV